MAISDEAVTTIENVLKLTQSLELDDLLILANAFLVQTQRKANLAGPAELVYMNLARRVKRRMAEGYVPDEALARIDAAVRG